MATAFTSTTWDGALKSYLLHLRAVRAPQTVQFYKGRLTQLARWADAEGVSLDTFTKRHLDAFLAARLDAGIARTTIRHEALAAKVFFKYCQRYGLIERSPLAEYEVPMAPKPFRYMPSETDMQKLTDTVVSFWDPQSNPDARFLHGPKRIFHRERNYAIVVLLIDSACRIGEALSLKVDDFHKAAKQITIRASKGKEPRTLPLSPESIQAVEDWLRVRRNVMSNVPPSEDEGWLFITETGTKMDGGRFHKTFKLVISQADLPSAITLHSIRRFAINRMAKHASGGIYFAQHMAGHKDPRTTEIYTKIDADYMRDTHEQVGVLRGVLVSKRSIARKRLV